MTWPTYPKELTDASWQKAKGLKARITTKTNVGAKLKALQEGFEAIESKRFTDLPPAGGETLFKQYVRMTSHADKFGEWKKEVAKARHELETTVVGLKKDDAAGNKSMIDHLALVDAHLETFVKRIQEVITEALTTAKQRQDEISDRIEKAHGKAAKLHDVVDQLTKDNIQAAFTPTMESLKKIVLLVWGIEGVQDALPGGVAALPKFMKLDSVPGGDLEGFKKSIKLGLEELQHKVDSLRVYAYHFGN